MNIYDCDKAIACHSNSLLITRPGLGHKDSWFSGSGFTVTGIPNEAFSDGFKSVRWIGATLVIVAGMLLLYPRRIRWGPHGSAQSSSNARVATTGRLKNLDESQNGFHQG